ncbi:MAG: sugar ABC transporter substrate-binding protein, partial [Eubacteriales bacterium]|nr:sugar ABC transporter substrate-binding protein [Eubacteriales bacterium]
DSHGASAHRRVTQSKQTRWVLWQDTPGESRLALEELPGTMEQTIAAPRFRNDRQANLRADSLVEAAIADEQNLDLQMARAHRELEEFLNR